MNRWLEGFATCGLLLTLQPALAGAAQPVAPVVTNAQSFMVRGMVKALKPDGRTVVVVHEAISNYMDAMTMPFRVKEPKELAGLNAGDQISFRLRVTETESWIEQVSRVGGRQETGDRGQEVEVGKLVRDGKLQMAKDSGVRSAEPGGRSTAAHHPLLDYHFTNELGQAVSLGDFRGQALAITFFFTRCPIPDYCPRLSKNFEEAAGKLQARHDAPTNWHFLSVSFDPAFDTPAVLKAYGKQYHYDPKKWNFLTGPADKIQELAAQSDVRFEADAGLFNHNFRTLIIDPAGHLQMVFPTSGDLSDAIVSEILKAAAVTNRGS
jgi:protein SCO1/2